MHSFEEINDRAPSLEDMLGDLDRSVSYRLGEWQEPDFGMERHPVVRIFREQAGVSVDYEKRRHLPPVKFRGK